MLLKAYLPDTLIVVDYKRIPFPMILSMLAGKIIIAEQAALKTLAWSTFPVFAWCAAAAVQAHGTLRLREPFQTLSELFETE
jgi:hypothetical protein